MATATFHSRGRRQPHVSVPGKPTANTVASGSLATATASRQPTAPTWAKPTVGAEAGIPTAGAFGHGRPQVLRQPTAQAPSTTTVWAEAGKPTAETSGPATATATFHSNGQGQPQVSRQPTANASGAEAGKPTAGTAGASTIQKLSKGALHHFLKKALHWNAPFPEPPPFDFQFFPRLQNSTSPIC
jgi:hypothetical protein